MTIDLNNERTLSLAAAARLLPPGRRGRPVSISCILRWIIDGVKTSTGVVRLEGLRLGSRWITSIEALERFAAEQTPSFEDGQKKTPRATAARQRAADRAGRELEKIGL
jgi:hypothetical protein